MTLPIDSSETLTRYLTKSKWIKKQYNAPSPQAFMPGNIGGSIELSVFRISGLSNELIWGIADEQVLPNLPVVKGGNIRTIHGRADIVVSDVSNVGLDVEPDDIPPGHANIVGWPNERHEQLSKAQELAANATLVLNA